MRCVSPHYPQASSSADAAASVDASAVGSSKSDGASWFRFLHFASVLFNHTKQTQHYACQLQLQLLVTTVLQLAHAHLASRSLLSSSPRLAPPHAAQVNLNHIIREFLLPPPPPRAKSTCFDILLSSWSLPSCGTAHAPPPSVLNFNPLFHLCMSMCRRGGWRSAWSYSSISSARRRSRG